MRIKSVYIRFYKAFNHDYLRKISPEMQKKARPWDKVRGGFYPFVRIELDSKITTVVGANESGKSQLLSAIQKAITGEKIADEDLCRYSPFFSVERATMRQPDFGVEWCDLTPADKERVHSALGVPRDRVFDSFHFFRLDGNTLTGYLPGEDTAYPVTQERAGTFLPRAFSIDSKIALPDSVPIATLIRLNRDESLGSAQTLDRRKRGELLDAFVNQGGAWLASIKAFTNAAGSVTPEQRGTLGTLADLLAPSAGTSKDLREQEEKQARLAHDLLLKVARVDRRALEDLARALRDGSDGFASALCDAINQRMAARLNFPRFWVQDSHFALLVTPRDHELVFTIRDRTGRQYTFNERSGGLKYFLSYYIQYLAHEPVGPDTEILLMDEPDAFLSSQAQQDLLRVFNAFAEGEGERKAVQVVYVTHSPFLIDKNHGERIRVLEKGVGDEGTRVVNRGSRNHYEPLRSSFGAFFAETASIGNCNLIVEGPGDQILLAAGAHFLRGRDTPNLENLDLNRLTIVPAGGASNVAYTVHLARGRGGSEHPAVIVLLDSDKAGHDARKSLAREPVRGRRLLDDTLVFQVGGLNDDAQVVTACGGEPVEIEDMVPLMLCVAVARRYATEFWGLVVNEAQKITEAEVSKHFVADASVFDALQQMTSSLYGVDFKIDKVGFARLVADLLSGREPQTWSHDEEMRVSILAGLDQFGRNMRALFRELGSRQRLAEKELTNERVSSKVERIKARFLQDYPSGANREQAGLMLKEIRDALDPGQEGDRARTLLDGLQRDYRIDEDPLKAVSDFEKFSEGLQQVRYANPDDQTR